MLGRWLICSFFFLVSALVLEAFGYPLGLPPQPRGAEFDPWFLLLAPLTEIPFLSSGSESEGSGSEKLYFSISSLTLYKAASDPAYLDDFWTN